MHPWKTPFHPLAHLPSPLSFFFGSSWRAVIEKYTKHTRFCLICNYVSKISQALQVQSLKEHKQLLNALAHARINTSALVLGFVFDHSPSPLNLSTFFNLSISANFQSRCTRFRFAPLAKEHMVEQVMRVVKAEGCVQCCSRCWGETGEEEEEEEEEGGERCESGRSVESLQPQTCVHHTLSHLPAPGSTRPRRALMRLCDSRRETCERPLTFCRLLKPPLLLFVCLCLSVRKCSCFVSLLCSDLNTHAHAHTHTHARTHTHAHIFSLSLSLSLSLLFEQSTFMAFRRVDEEGVYLSTGTPLPSDIQAIVEVMLNDSFSAAYTSE